MLLSRERGKTSVALTPTLYWFETRVLGHERNYQGLARLNGGSRIWPARARPATRIVPLDTVA